MLSFSDLIYTRQTIVFLKSFIIFSTSQSIPDIIIICLGYYIFFAVLPIKGIPEVNVEFLISGYKIAILYALRYLARSTRTSWLLVSLPSIKVINDYKMLLADLISLLSSLYFHKHPYLSKEPYYLLHLLILS